MKIAVVGPTYPHRGGIVHYTSLLVSHLREQHSVRAYGFKRLYPDRLYPGNSQADPSVSPLVSVESRQWLIPWNPFSWRRVRRDWASWHPDTVVIQWWVPFLAPMTSWLASRARRLGCHVVVLCHNILPHERRLLDKPLIRIALRAADRLIVHSQTDREIADRLLSHTNVRVIPHPSYEQFASETWTRDKARTSLGLQGRVLLFFGIVRPYKGLLDLLDALPAVLQQCSVTLLVVGEIWGSIQVYRRRVAELGLDAQVQFVDRYVSNDEAAMYFAAADLVVLPYREATGSGALQLAFGLGVPVVATRTGGLAEAVVDGDTGFLVEPGDVSGLSQAIVRFFIEDRADSFRQALRRDSARFSWDQMIAAIVFAA